MKKFIGYYLKAFYGKEVELRIKLFHVLATTGFIICVAMTIVSILGHMMISMFINMGAGLVSLFLLIFSAKKGHYQFCYATTLVVIFFILFPSLFFSGGGYKGGMPFFFVFAAVFTVYMLDGWLMPVATAVELLLYIGICILAYRRPDLVVPFESEGAVLTDVIIGLVTVSISLGATMYVQIRLYQQQQKNLQKAQKAAEAANMAKSSFLANMSHEIRTPIHMILGMNEIILRESRNKQVIEYSEKIDETSKMLLSLVDSILDVSKIESGKMELIPDMYESASLVKILRLIGKTYCDKKNLSFICDVAEDLPEMLFGDMARIRQVAANFLSNAAKYTETGSVTLSIQQEPAKEEGKILLCISVKDTGIGIKKEDIPALFNAFMRADEASHRQIRGVGLGLAISRELADLMNGKIYVDSELGQGTTFTIKLPQEIVERKTAVEKEKTMTFLAPNVKMLIVDDNEGNRMMMRELLVPTRIQIDTASSGLECLQMVEENAYDVILMDYMMPGLNGLETVEQLKKKEGFHTPVIALTADATPDTKTRLLQGGFTAYLSKPIPWEKLKKVLLSFLPEESVEIVPEWECEKTEDFRNHDLEERLKPYGIIMENAMQYFSNDLEEYNKVAELFLRHNEQEKRKIKRFFETQNYKQLRFPIHALKGKAKNLGMEKLSQVCAYVEELCAADNGPEIDSIMPYLKFWWDKGSEGLGFLAKKDVEETMEGETTWTELESCLKQLPDLLHDLRRKPSLDCIKKILVGETDPEGRKLLEKTAEYVSTISFEEAEHTFQSYLKWKTGGVVS